MGTGSPVVRVRVPPGRQDELDELQNWTSSRTFADLFWKAIEALKRESSFDARDDDEDEVQPPGLPPFVPGAGN